MLTHTTRSDRKLRHASGRLGKVTLFAIAAFAPLAGTVRHAAAEDFPVVVTTPPLSPAEEQAKFHLPPGFEIQLGRGRA